MPQKPKGQGGAVRDLLSLLHGKERKPKESKKKTVSGKLLVWSIVGVVVPG